mmetsp:Transcript_9117/g.26468  ORF Transcript_9117/g.26468 Transcript_9117/m.26468 type:complete len:238 (+) Transcript_9117:348-1061(+)
MQSGCQVGLHERWRQLGAGADEEFPLRMARHVAHGAALNALVVHGDDGAGEGVQQFLAAHELLPDGIGELELHSRYPQLYRLLGHGEEALRPAITAEVGVHLRVHVEARALVCPGLELRQSAKHLSKIAGECRFEVRNPGRVPQGLHGTQTNVHVEVISPIPLAMDVDVKQGAAGRDCRARKVVKRGVPRRARQLRTAEEVGIQLLRVLWSHACVVPDAERTGRSQVLPDGSRELDG